MHVQRQRESIRRRAHESPRQPRPGNLFDKTVRAIRSLLHDRAAGEQSAAFKISNHRAGWQDASKRRATRCAVRRLCFVKVRVITMLQATVEPIPLARAAPDAGKWLV